MNAVIIGMIFGALASVGLAIQFPPDDVMSGVLFGAFCTMVGGLTGVMASKGTK